MDTGAFDISRSFQGPVTKLMQTQKPSIFSARESPALPGQRSPGWLLISQLDPADLATTKLRLVIS